MAVNNTELRIRYECDGLATVFPITIAYILESDLKVTHYDDSTATQETLVLNMDYTISGEAVNTIEAYPSPDVITISRDIEMTQLIDLQAGDDLDPDSIESAMDKLTMIALQLKDRAGRNVSIPDTDEIDTMEIPPKSVRAGKTLYFDEDGAIQAGISLSVPVGSPVVESALAESEVANFRSGIGLPTNGALVSGFNADKLDGADKSTDTTFSSNSDNKIPTEKAAKTYVDTALQAVAEQAVKKFIKSDNENDQKDVRLELTSTGLQLNLYDDTGTFIETACSVDFAGNILGLSQYSEDGTNELASLPDLISTAATSYATVSHTIINIDGTVRYRAEISNAGSSLITYFRVIRLRDFATVVSGTKTGTSYLTVEAAFSVIKGDALVIQLYTNNSSFVARIRNQSISSSIPRDSLNGVSIMKNLWV